MTNIYAVLLAAVPALLNIGILIYLLSSLPTVKTTRVFVLFIVALVLWQAEDSISRIVTSEEEMQFWDRMLCIGWLSVGPLILNFVLWFTSAKRAQSSFSLFVLYFPFFLFYTIYVSQGQPVSFRHHEFWGWVSNPRPGSLDIIQRHFISVAVLIALILLFNYVYRQRHNRKKARQGLLIAIGVLIPAIQGSITQVMLPAYFGTEIPVTSTFMTFLSVAIIIALKKYHLFNISESLQIRGVLNSLSNYVLIISPDEKILYQNEFCGAKLGLGADAGDKDLRSLFPADGKSYGRFKEEVFDPTIQGGSVADHMTRFVGRAHTQRDVLLSSEVVQNNGIVQGVLVIANDITERNMYHEAIKDQNRRFREIAWTQSHVVRAPLARILGLVEMLCHPGTVEADRPLLLDYLRASSEELDQVIRNIVAKTSEVGEEVPARMSRSGDKVKAGAKGGELKAKG